MLAVVDGVSVAGRRAPRYEGLTRVAAGAGIKLGLADGRTVELKAE